jgi:hypothetical protein
MKLTRRALAKMIAATAAVPAAAMPQSDATDPQKAARERFERNAQAMAAVRVPNATEPPFHFKA